MRKSTEHTEDTIGSGHRPNPPLFSIVASQAQNRPVASIHRNECCECTTRTPPPLPVTLDPVSISKDEDFVAILERALRGEPIKLVATTSDRITRAGYPLIRHVIEMPGGSIELVEEEDSIEQFDIRTLMRLSLPSATPCMESAVVKGTRKIRVFQSRDVSHS